MISKVEITNVNTSKLPVLTNEEKQELFIKIKQGDKKAREKFINGNLKLVLSVVKKFNNRGENVDDLFQVGCVGLIKAIDNFDLSQNVLFSTYAVPMIIGEIRRHLRDNNAIRVSRSLRYIAYKSLQAKEKLIIFNSKEPTLDEIAKEVRVTKEETNRKKFKVSKTSFFVNKIQIFCRMYCMETKSTHASFPDPPLPLIIMICLFICVKYLLTKYLTYV